MNNSGNIASIVVIVALLSGGPGISHAQDKPELPTPPYVAAVPDFFAWTMTIKDKTDKTKEPAASPTNKAGNPIPQPFTILKVVCTRTKDIKRDVIFYHNGYSSEVWYDQNYAIVRFPNHEFEIFPAGSPDVLSSVPDVSGRGFIGVDWITAGNFQTKTKLEDGTEVYVYGGETRRFQPIRPTTPIFDLNGKTISPPPPSDEMIPMKATIAVDSRLPLVIEKNTTILTYSYQAPPTEMLELPADMQKKLAVLVEKTSYIEQMRKLEQQ